MFLEIVLLPEISWTRINVFLFADGQAALAESMGWGHILNKEELDVATHHLRERWGQGLP